MYYTHCFLNRLIHLSDAAGNLNQDSSSSSRTIRLSINWLYIAPCGLVVLNSSLLCPER